jgi:hypothetical protein
MVLGGSRRFGLVLARGRVRRVLLLAGLVFATLPAGSALADITIGQTGGSLSCGRPFTPFVDSNYVVPSGGGRITSFSYLSDSGDAGAQVDFLVLRHQGPGPGGGAIYTVVGKTGVVTLKGTGLETFPANIAVQSGRGGRLVESIGLATIGQSDLDNCLRTATDIDGGLRYSGTQTDPSVGDTMVFSPPGPADLNESANLATGVGGPPPPTSKAQCKHGGWKNFPEFKNQGQCMRFVSDQDKKHDHKHHPSRLAVRVWGS